MASRRFWDGATLELGLLPIVGTPATAYGVAGITGWWDISDTASITFGTGTLVAGVAEQNGNGHDFAQGTGTNQPNRNTTINSLDTAAFDGTDNFLALGSVLTVPDAGCWFFFVIDPSGTGDRTIIGGNSGHLQIRVTTAGNLNVLRSDTADCGSSDGTVNLHDGSPHVCAVFVSTGERRFYIDGTACGTVTAAAGGSFTDWSKIGTKEGSTEWGQFDGGEFLYFDSDIGLTDAAVVWDALLAKWIGGGAGAQTIEPPFLASTSSLYAPTVTTGAVTITLPHIASTASLFAPTVTAGAVAVTLPHLASPAALYAPTVITGAVSVLLPTIASAAVLLAPTVTTGAVTITLPTIASSAVLYAPTVSQGAQVIEPPAIASAAVLFAPTVTTGAVSVLLPTIASSAVLYAPTVTTGAVTVALPHLASASTLYPPTVAAGAVGVLVPFLASTVTTYAPTVTVGAATIEPPFLASTAAPYPPTITVGAVALVLPHIASTAGLYAFTVTQPGPPIVGSVTARWAEPSIVVFVERSAARWAEPGVLTASEPASARWLEPFLISGGDQ